MSIGIRRKNGSADRASAGGRSSRALTTATSHGESLGTGYLGVGASILAVVQSLYGFSIFLRHAHSYPHLEPVVIAWVLYFLMLAGVGISVSIRGERMSTWLFAGVLTVLAAVLALDLIAIWPLHNVGMFASASGSVGFGLLVAITLRSGLQIFLSVSIFGAVILAAMLIDTPFTPANIPSQVIMVATAILPVLFGLWVIQRFRRIVQLELDRVLVHSTVSAPRFAVGMLASEELARLDLAAEELLQSVATGRTALPLTAKVASTAASLATELRLHLIEGRRETWLYHAITESDQLGRSVTLADRGGLAGLLGPQQRDGLLSAVWLLVSDQNKGVPTAKLTIGPIAAQTDPATRTLTVPLVISTTAIPRNRVDPAIWDALGRVGRFVDSSQNSSLHVEIECVVISPVDQ